LLLVEYPPAAIKGIAVKRARANEIPRISQRYVFSLIASLH